MAKDDLKAATLGMSSDINAAYQSAEQLPQSNAVMQAGGYNDAAQVENAKAAKRAALEAQAQKAADMADPSKYQMLPKDDGGYQFVAPNGKEISAYDYSRITGSPIDSILKDSQNPIDIGFVQDFSNLQNFMQAVLNKDKETVDSIVSQNKELENYRNDIPGLLKRFRQAYPTVFGGGGFQGRNTPGVRAGSTYIPAGQSQDSGYTGLPGGVSINSYTGG